jgi:hypothetical protein
MNVGESHINKDGREVIFQVAVVLLHWLKWEIKVCLYFRQILESYGAIPVDPLALMP